MRLLTLETTEEFLGIFSTVEKALLHFQWYYKNWEPQTDDDYLPGGFKIYEEELDNPAVKHVLEEYWVDPNDLIAKRGKYVDSTFDMGNGSIKCLKFQEDGFYIPLER